MINLPRSAYLQRFGRWEVDCDPENGGRLRQLRHDGLDLLTAEPEIFEPPSADYGLYETRPVFGYDDCFPSVDPCWFPQGDWEVPDHGELCWLKWNVETEANGLVLWVESERMPLTFWRTLHFGKGELTWSFEIASQSDVDLGVMHVMHALMPISEITKIELPEFVELYDEVTEDVLDVRHADLPRLLLNEEDGTARMLLCRGLREGRLALSLKAGKRLTMEFPVDLFPTLGIWWNRKGFPDETRCRREECAFEPVPGSTSCLEDAYHDGSCLVVPAGKSLEWSVRWRIGDR